MKEFCVITKKNYWDPYTRLAISPDSEAYIQKLNEIIPGSGSYEIVKVYKVDDDFLFQDFIDALKELFPDKYIIGSEFSIESSDFISFLNNLCDANGFAKQENSTNTMAENDEEAYKEDTRNVKYEEEIDGDEEEDLFEASSPLTKKDYAQILRDKGYNINEKLTLSSLNKNGKYYWSNAPVEYLFNDWSLMLNDTVNHILYLFDIKAYSINPALMTLRKGEGREHCMQLEFEYSNEDFLEVVSGVKFKPYLVGQVQYESKSIENDDNAVEINKRKSGVITAPLSKIYVSDIPYFAEVLSFDFEGIHHDVKENKELVDFMFNYLYQEDPSLFRKSAHSNSLIKYFYFGTPSDDDIDEYYKMNDVDIYYKKEIANEGIKKGVLAIKRFFDKTKFNKSLSSLKITIDYGDNGYIHIDEAEFDW